MRIYLVRHGESQANVDKSVHFDTADHAIPLSIKGIKQAHDAGKFLGNELASLDYTNQGYFPKKTRIWMSPYARTRQTALSLTTGITMTYKDAHWDTRENIRLCEQQFGLFDGIEEHQLPIVYPQEYEHYRKCEIHEGRFWARMPLGESRFDVANRVYQTFGTFHRDFERHGIDTIVVVCHGVTLRAFVMQWLHKTPEWFDEEPNPGNCDIRLLENDIDHGYIYRGIK